MRNLTHLVISLPLLATPLALANALPARAAAQNVGPTGAVKLLAESRTIDAKCNYLSSREHSELNDYVAKAEIAAATMTSAPEAQSARRTGNKLGKASVCGRTSEELVRATLDAARRAMVAARSQRKARTVARRQPRQQKRLVRIQPETRSSTRIATVSNPTSLTRYRRMTEAYYLERRCQHLSRPEAVRFWKRVVASHNAVLQKYSVSQVSKAKSGAERAARGWGRCGSRTARIVQAGYRG
ncbi:MAG TPA: hypothetical protein ENJ55_03735 [Rhizobiales bacterium]|nr:hypothetical protein [Hyphomicrobiales bacterium]